MAISNEPNFDRVARVYRWAEYASLGTLLETMREYFLPQLGGARQALILGDGDGRFTKKLLESNIKVRVHAVDLSAKMLELLFNRAGAHCDRLSLIRDNALDVDLPQSVDLVVTHFFLDCLTQPEVDDLIARVSGNTIGSAFWVISDFAIPQGWLELPSRIYIRALYAAFRLLAKLRVQQLPNPQVALKRAGFARIQRYERLGGLVYTEIWKHE